jgi:hypothetical protein
VSVATPLAADEAMAVRPLSVSFTLGVKAGLIPPLGVAPELLLHPGNLMLGVFGITLPGGGNGSRYSIGGEFGYEFAQPGQSTPYVLGTVLHYDESANSAGRYERTDVATITAGYEWKSSRVEIQLGGGALFVLNDEVPACTGFCFNWNVPPVLPTLDFALRYRF